MAFFPGDLPELEWTQFQAAGFDTPVAGVIYTDEKHACCGVPLGGVSTGCIDIDVRGVYGYSSIFHPKSPRYEHSFTPRKAPSFQPILALSLGDGKARKTWVLAARPFIEGGDIASCENPAIPWGEGVKKDIVHCPKLEGVEAVKKIRYWGHFPIADVAFETDAPVTVSMRAWSALLPGDALVSNTPFAVFEVHLQNESSDGQSGTLAFNFPGPDAQEARGGEFTRTRISEDYEGVLVSSQGGVQYILGVINERIARFGAGFGDEPTGWARIAEVLPSPWERECGGQKVTLTGSCSVAVDFDLAASQTKTVRFLLAWYAPVWEGTTKQYAILKPWQAPQITADMNPDAEAQLEGYRQSGWLSSQHAPDVNHYTQMYAARFSNALDVARRVVDDHESWLGRVLAWQKVVYDEESLPVWLRDSLVNNLSLIAEDSYWAQARPPLGDWCFPLGAFGLLESPRSCPQMCCIPCEWLGSLPIVYFYPELARQTLRTFKQYQLDNGEVPFAIGRVASLPDFTTPKYYWQVSCNGPWYLMLIDRLWTCTGDDSVLREFYESARQSNTFTMSLSTGPEGVISMPDIGGMEGFEMGEWAGMTAHLAFLRLASLRIMRRMAEAMGDDVYVAECQQWLDDGTSALEHELWTDGYYLNFYDKKTNEKSDAVMGYQFDGQWVAWSHGDGDLAQHERIQSTLEKIRCCNAALTPNDGAANFAQPDGTAMPTDDTVAEYGPYAYFPPHGLILAMTYMYAGDKEFGLEFARKIWRNMILTHRHPWDLPNMVRGDTGERIVGTEYYQNMILWAMPAALEGEHLGGPCRENGLVHRVLRAAGVTQ